METNTKQTEKMSKPQKVIVIVTAILLALILILVLTTRYMGSGRSYPIDNQGAALNTETSNDNSNPSTNGDAGGNTAADSGTENGGNKPGNGSGSATSDSDAGQTPNETPPHANPSGDNSRPDSENSGSNTPPEPSEPGNLPGTDQIPSTGPSDSSSTQTPDVGQSGIYDGASVTVTEIGESMVTFRVGSETVTIPVQTTVFNGRVTKSGVISDSLCGYSIGASVMLYYPESAPLEQITFTGAYVKADATRLTVSGDYNGNDSKAVFRLNGVKLA